MKGGSSIKHKKMLLVLLAGPPVLLALLYAGGYLAQFIANYNAWKQAGGYPGDGTSPMMPSASFLTCIQSVFTPPYGVFGIFICAGLLLLLIALVMKMGFSDNGEYDRERNLIYSRKGTYGTAGFMSRKEMAGVLDLVPDIRRHKGTILGMLDKQVVCIPEDTPFNSNIAVYGASGSKKTRA